MTPVHSYYEGAPWYRRIFVAARPLICPTAPVVSSVPVGSTVLDVGCGVGVLLISLALQGKLVSGTGCDVSGDVVRIAKDAASQIPNVNLQFVTTPSLNDIPSGPFDVVTIIDVMHHIRPSGQRQFFAACLKRLLPGGRLIYKDMADKPLWKNLFNRLHDVIIARQHIYYVPLEEIKNWGGEAGLCLVQESVYSRFGYGHELLVFNKPA